MAVVFFSANGSPWRQAEIPVSEYTRVWSGEREFGSAKLFLPRGHAILATDAVDENGGTRVRIDHALLPSWYGIQEGPMDQGPDGWGMEATEIGILLKYNDVPPLTMGGPYTAGEIIDRAFSSLTDRQRGGIAPGSFVVGPPLINDYAIDGGPFADILVDLADQSGQGWEITEEAGSWVLHWQAMRGAVYEPLLTEGYDLVDVHRTPDTSTLVRRVRAINADAGVYGEASAPELADDPLAQTTTITSEQTSMLALEQEAETHLNRHRYRSVRYRFGVRGHWTRTSVTATAPDMGESGGGFPLMGGGFVLMGGGFPLMGGGSTPGELDTTYPTFSTSAWSIRPGDYIRAVCTSAGKTGTTILARVVRVTFGDGFAHPVFDCQELMPFDPSHLVVRSYRPQRQIAQPNSVPRLLASVAS